MKSQPNQTFNQANAQTDKGHNHEHEQQGLARDAGSERRHPRNSLSNKGGDVGQNSCHSHKPPPLQANQAPNQANTQTHERNNNEHENQGVRSNNADKGTDPLHSFGDKGRNVGKNSSDSNGSLRLKRYHLSNKNTNPLLSNARNIPDYTNDNNKEAKADKVAKRLRHEKRREMFEKPEDKGLHISHGADPLPA